CNQSGQTSLESGEARDPAGEDRSQNHRGRGEACDGPQDDTLEKKTPTRRQSDRNDLRLAIGLILQTLFVSPQESGFYT
ncbi:hypothetical protein PENTCL1PPCAC_20984, partial [Pristionchus entomophagus]